MLILTLKIENLDPVFTPSNKSIFIQGTPCNIFDASPSIVTHENDYQKKVHKTELSRIKEKLLKVTHKKQERNQNLFRAGEVCL